MPSAFDSDVDLSFISLVLIKIYFRFAIALASLFKN